MKNIFKVSMLIAMVLFWVTSAWALPIGVGDRIQVTAGDRFLVHHMKTGDTYDAFCVERTIYFQYGENMFVQSVGNEATTGGPNDGTPGPNGGDPLAQETIWLYASYWDGLFGVHTDSLMMQVQHAIWFMEDEYDAGVTAYNDLITMGGSTVTDFSVTGWDIQVINPVGADGREKQSLLVGNPVPEPATMLLFGAGLLGMGLARLQRRNRS